VSRFVPKGLEGVRLSRIALEATEENYGTFESGQREKERKRMKRVQNCCKDRINEPV
jgi:hypothetical protein